MSPQSDHLRSDLRVSGEGCVCVCDLSIWTRKQLHSDCRNATFPTLKFDRSDINAPSADTGCTHACSVFHFWLDNQRDMLIQGLKILLGSIQDNYFHQAERLNQPKRKIDN